MSLGSFTPRKTAVQSTQTVARGPGAEVIREEILKVVEHTSDHAPRNLQVAIGPSESGHPCARNIAHKLAQTTTGRNPLDPWPSIVGTAVHAWLEEAFEAENIRRPGTWLTERTVTVAGPAYGFPELKGHGDSFHVPSGTVIDYKVLGATQHREYVGGYVSDQYRNQIHQYGLGYQNEGYEVNTVALAIFGRTKTLRDLYVWTEPYDRSRAIAAVARLRQIQMVIAGGVDPMKIKATPGGGCHFCPWRPDCPEAQK